MTRVQEISLEILNQLARFEEPRDAAVLHALVNARLGVPALDTEFRDGIQFASDEGLIAGVRDPLRGVLWSITNKGKAARHA